MSACSLATCRKTRQAALGLATALSKLADGPPLLSSCGAPADWPHAAHAQLRAASLVLTRCMRVGQRLGLTAKEGKRILYAAQLVLRASPLSLAAGRAAVAGGALPQQLELTSSLAAHCAAHASALDAVLQLYQAPKNKNALALFASDVARPDVLLPWARELAQALLALPVELFSGNEGEWAGNLGEVRAGLLSSPLHPQSCVPEWLPLCTVAACCLPCPRCSLHPVSPTSN